MRGFSFRHDDLVTRLDGESSRLGIRRRHDQSRPRSDSESETPRHSYILTTPCRPWRSEGRCVTAARAHRPHWPLRRAVRSDRPRAVRITASAAATLTTLALLAAGCGGFDTARLARAGSGTFAASTPVASGGDRIASEQPARSARRQPRRKDWRALAAWLRQRARAGKFSGAVLVAGDGTPVVKLAGGLADRTRKLANAVDTRFNIGSVGKMFTAVAIAQLVEAGKLSFEDPIGKYLSGFPPEVAGKVTIGQLLTHTSGLGDVFMRWHPTAPSQLDVSDLMTRIVREPLQFEPGSRFAYSNSGFVMLGAVVEAVTGQDYYEYVRTHVFRP